MTSRQRRPAVTAIIFAAWCPAATGCRTDARPPWRCQPIGRGEACVDARRLALPPPPWTCHERRGRLLCAAPGAAPLPGGAWRCRRDGTESLCVRDGLPLPDRPAAEAPGADDEGWRCWLEPAGGRRCRPRAWGNGPWRCDDRGGCARRYPDFPNRWEWGCFETRGRTICGSDTPAPTDAAWTCRAQDDRMTCVDADPDVPAPPPARWSCRLEAAGDGTDVARRVCHPDDTPPCVQDAQCSGGFCLDRQCVRARLSADEV